MSTPDYARRAARLLARHEPAAPNTGASRERGMATIERALAAERPRRRISIVASLAAVVAGLIAWASLTRVGSPLPGASPLASVVVLVSPIREGVVLRDSQGEAPVQVTMPLPGGGRLATGSDGGAALQLSTGTRLELGSASDMTLERQDALQRFALHRGLVDARVAKLGLGERFVIDTPDAQIEVRGTVFRLEVLQSPEECGAGARSRLDVREGVVEVRAGSRVIRVGAGEHWPPDCQTGGNGKRKEPSPPASPAAADAGGVDAEVPPSALPAGRARSSKHSLLTSQNDAFRDALRVQERAGTSAALRAYADFIQRYPSSPLAENALVQRMRLLATSDPTRAKAEASRYLEQYPDGFARAEAERLREAP